MSKNTTLCYLELNGKYLMLHRVKKQVDENKDKWIGVGGHMEEGEAPEECLVREVLEETGLKLLDYRLRGIVTFVSDRYETDYMFLFTSDCFEGTMIECDEGDLEWVEKSRVYDLPIWEGDKVFFRLLEEREDVFLLTLRYQGDKLVETIADGRKIENNDKIEGE